MLVPNQQRGGHGHGKMSCKQEHSLQRHAVRQSLRHLGLLLSGSGADWHTRDESDGDKVHGLQFVQAGLSAL